MLSSKKIWIFDLDNTLYSECHDLFPMIERRMGHFIVQKLGFSEYRAKVLQKEYYQNCGTTLSGLMQFHAVDPQEYLEFVHDIDYSVIPPNLALKTALEGITAECVIFTNGSTAHAKNVLKRLGLSDLFSKIFDIKDCNYIPKPNPKAFDYIIERLDNPPSDCVMVEDLAHNLKYPKLRGMATILVKTSAPMSKDMVPIIDHFTDDLAEFLRQYA